MREWRFLGPLSVLLMLFGAGTVNAARQQSQGQDSPAPGQSGNELVIENESELPETYPQAPYEFSFRAHGGVPLLHWHLEKGHCPRE